MAKLPTKLVHYSYSAIEKLKLDHVYEDRSSRKKPGGLWMSVEDYANDQTWKTWCIIENFRVDHLQYAYHVKLKLNANILFLNSTKKLLKFSYKYGIPFPIIQERPQYRHWRDKIRWEEVKSYYDGIIIAPYRWDCDTGLLTGWYYGWDCASGCIWNLSCIEDFPLLYHDPHMIEMVKIPNKFIFPT